jgi:hypothetical protein
VLKALVCHACFFVFMAFSTWFYGGHLFLAGGIRGSEFSHTCLKGFVLDSPIDFVFFSIPPFATRLIYIHSVTSRPFHFILWGCNGTELVEWMEIPLQDCPFYGCDGPTDYLVRGSRCFPGHWPAAILTCSIDLVHIP